MDAAEGGLLQTAPMPAGLTFKQQRTGGKREEKSKRENGTVHKGADRKKRRGDRATKAPHLRT